MSTVYDSEITIHRLSPPLGGLYHYTAKIRLVHGAENGARERLRLPFDEVWGETEEEARRQAEALIARLIGDAATVETAAILRRRGPIGRHASHQEFSSVAGVQSAPNS